MKLKSCPFCRATQETFHVERVDGTRTWQTIECTNCDTVHQGQDALEHWNTRPVEDALAEALESVEWTRSARVGCDHPYTCPWCLETREDGHAPDCTRQAAIARGQ